MQQYLIHAYDYTDAQALERRMAVRPLHLELMAKFKLSGNYVLGGAILDAQGKMIGSNLVLQFETKEELDAYQAQEPYIQNKVWEKITITPFRVATVAAS
jgi:uncharacterized protein